VTALLWLSAAFLATTGLYTAWGTWIPEPGFAVAFAAAIAVALPSFRAVRIFKVESWVYAAVGAVAIVGLFAPPCRPASVLLLAGISLLLAGRGVALLRAGGLALLLVGVAYQAQAVASFVYAKIEARWHAWETLRPAAASILRLTGHPVAVTDRGIALLSGGEVIQVDVNPEILGLRFLLGFTTAGLVMILLFRRTKLARSIRRLFLIGVLYVAARFVYMTFLYAEVHRLGVFSDPPWQLLTFLPVVLIVDRAVPLDAPSSALEFGSAAHRTHRVVLFYALSALAALSLASASLFVDPGELKQGRLLIDEGHSDWEWTDTPMDRETFGMKSTYNYLWLNRLLGHYYEVETIRQTLDASALSRTDVLIVKTPTRQYARNEIDAIEAFVRNGGGLFLVSDHTDVFGMTTYINPIASRFGLRFARDATYDLRSGDESVFQPWMALPHPVVRGVPPLTFMTSCTLDAPLRSHDVVTGRGLGTLRPDYSSDSFLPDDAERFIQPRFGAFLQAVALPAGEGRVAAFTDSTIFSSFSLFLPGNRELLLNVIDWLNRRNTHGWLRPVLLGIGLSAVILLIPLARRGAFSNLMPGAVLAASVGLAGAWLVAEGVVRVSYPSVVAHTPYVSACFELSHSPKLRSRFDDDAAGAESYVTFYVWTQRTGVVPAVESDLSDCGDADLIVLVEPTESISGTYLDSLKRYLAGGGRVLVLDDPRNTDSSAETLLEGVGLSVVGHEPYRTTLRQVDSQDSIIDVMSERTIAGGDPWIVTDSGDVVAAAVDVGQGKLVAMMHSSIFTDARMGSRVSTPDKRQLSLSRLEFWLLERLLPQSRSDSPDISSGGSKPITARSVGAMSASRPPVRSF
jgi:hypothetical protein